MVNFDRLYPMGSHPLFALLSLRVVRPLYSRLVMLDLVGEGLLYVSACDRQLSGCLSYVAGKAAQGAKKFLLYLGHKYSSAAKNVPP